MCSKSQIRRTLTFDVDYFLLSSGAVKGQIAMKLQEEKCSHKFCFSI